MSLRTYDADTGEEYIPLSEIAERLGIRYATGYARLIRRKIPYVIYCERVFVQVRHMLRLEGVAGQTV